MFDEVNIDDSHVDQTDASAEFYSLTPTNSEHKGNIKTFTDAFGYNEAVRGTLKRSLWRELVMQSFAGSGTTTVSVEPGPFVNQGFVIARHPMTCTFS